MEFWTSHQPKMHQSSTELVLTLWNQPWCADPRRYFTKHSQMDFSEQACGMTLSSQARAT